MVNLEPDQILDGQLKINLDALPKVSRAGYAVHEKSALRVRHLDLWSLHAVRYEGKLNFAGQTFELRPGVVSLTPPNVDVHWTFFRRSPHIYVHFRAASAKEGLADSVPVVSDLGDRFNDFFHRLEDMMEEAETGRLHTNVRLWDCLLELVDRNPLRECDEPRLSPVIQQVVRIIRNEVGSPLRAAELAARLNLSQTHLNSIFRNAHDCTLYEYIQRYRVKTAVHLLQNTNRTIKSIANEVGIPDAQHFNKVIRLRTGVSPKMLREVHRDRESAP